MSKEVFIIGANGLIGGALYGVFNRENYVVFGGDKEAAGKDFIFVDITDRDTLEQEIHRIKPDILILTAALSHVDYCEEFPVESEKVNIEGLKNVLDSIDKEKTNLVYFSSDYIFDGLSGPYSENDKPNPLCVYGKHKLMGEELIRDKLKNYLIIRTTWAYGPEQKGKNFVLRLLRELKDGEKVKVPLDQIGSPTYSENLAEAVEELVSKEKKGVYNIAGSELTDRYSFAREICNVFGFPESMLVPVPTQELGQRAKRPLRAGLKTDKVENEISTRLLNYKDGLILMKKNIHYE